MTPLTGQLTVMAETLIDADAVDYAILAIYFGSNNSKSTGIGYC